MTQPVTGVGLAFSIVSVFPFVIVPIFLPCATLQRVSNGYLRCLECYNTVCSEESPKTCFKRAEGEKSEARRQEWTGRIVDDKEEWQD
jgi:hypothetical protein